MANYASSVLVDAIGILSDKYQGKEFRRPIYGGHEMFLKGSEYTIPDLAEIRKSVNRTTTAKYLKRSNPTVASTFSCTPTATVGDSGTVNLSWTPYTTAITISNKRHGNNYFDRARALAGELEAAFRNLHDSIETAMVAYLEANKTGVNAGSSVLGTFDSTFDIFKVANANKDRYYNYLMTVMRENKYYNELMAVQNVAAWALINEQVAQGQANSTNLRYQYGDIDFMASHSISTGSDLVTSYVAEPDSVAVLDWIDPLNREGAVAGEREWTTMQDLYGYPWTWQVLNYKTCADTSQTGGYTQDLTEVWEIGIHLSLAKAPLSNAGETPIFKFALLPS